MSPAFENSAAERVNVPPSIEFNDDCVSIEGTNFWAEPTFEELQARFGPPDQTETSITADGKTYTAFYCWYELGISAAACEPDQFEPLRIGRIRVIRLTLDPAPFHAMIKMGRVGENTWQLPAPGKLKPFTGNLTICGQPLKSGSTANDFMSKKAVETVRTHSFEDDTWATSGESCRIAVAVIGRKSLKSSGDENIAIADLFFKAWQPSPALVKSLSLEPSERFVNFLNTPQIGNSYFEAVLTNLRLAVRSPKYSIDKQWNLNSTPQIALRGSSIVPTKYEGRIVGVAALIILALLCLSLLIAIVSPAPSGYIAAICILALIVAGSAALLCGFNISLNRRVALVTAQDYSDTRLCFYYHEANQAEKLDVISFIRSLHCEVTRTTPSPLPVPKIVIKKPAHIIPKTQHNETLWIKNCSDCGSQMPRFAESCPSCKQANSFWKNYELICYIGLALGISLIVLSAFMQRGDLFIAGWNLFLIFGTFRLLQFSLETWRKA